jgi:hypothetical protein
VEFFTFREVYALLFDADNTLFEHGKPQAPPPSLERIASVLPCAILTDSHHRFDEYESKTGLKVVRTQHLKPLEGAFLDGFEVLKQMYESYRGRNGIPDADLQIHNVAMIGDMIAKDIVGANKVGMYTLKVRPVKYLSEPLTAHLARYLGRASRLFC